MQKKSSALLWGAVAVELSFDGLPGAAIPTLWLSLRLRLSRSLGLPLSGKAHPSKH